MRAEALLCLLSSVLGAQNKPPPLPDRPRAVTTSLSASTVTAVRNLAGFRASILSANDDGFTGAVPLGFTVNFFGASTSTVFVNNNGNVTFTQALSQYTPNGLAAGVGQPIIAPFFGDVDTRGVGSGLVTYGTATITDAAEGWVNRQAFGVEWPAVGYYGLHIDKLNTFELLLVDRSDTGVGNFDIEFNYNSMQWESGDASGGIGGSGGISAAVGYSNGLSGTNNVFLQLVGSLTNGALINGGANALISNSRNSGVLGRYYFQVRNGTVIGSLTLLDPVSGLVNSSGNGIISDSANPALTSNRVIARLGVAADGATKLVVRFAAPTAGMVTFALVDQIGNIVPSNGDNGALSDLQGLPLDGTRMIPTVSNGGGQKAFAVYLAPSQFARPLFPADLTATNRQVFIKVSLSGGGPPLIAPILVLRPPVVLVHGLWSDSNAWNSFAIPSDRTCTDSGRYYACRADYGSNSADSFATSAPIVGSQIRQFINQFKSAKSVAAVQADVVAHSMGGDLIRVLPLCGLDPFTSCTFSYLTALNFRVGDIHRLITIGTPHAGSPLADRLASNRSTGCGSAGFWGNFTTFKVQWESHTAKLLGGAIDDLSTTSPAIAALTGHGQPFPIHFVVGVASSADEGLVDGPEGVIPAIRACNTNIVGPSIRATLNNEDSDLVVTVSSQRNNLAPNHPFVTISAPTYGNLIHSAAIVQSGQSGFSPEELNSTALSVLGAEIIKILDLGPFL